MQIDLTAKEIALCITALNTVIEDLPLINDCSQDDLIFAGIIMSVRDRLYSYIDKPKSKIDKRTWRQDRNVWCLPPSEKLVFEKTVKK